MRGRGSTTRLCTRKRLRPTRRTHCLLCDGQLQLRYHLLYKRRRTSLSRKKQRRDSACEEEKQNKDSTSAQTARKPDMGLARRHMRSKGPAPKPGAVGRVSIQVYFLNRMQKGTS